MNRPVNILHKHVASRLLILQNFKLLCCFKTIDIIAVAFVTLFVEGEELLLIMSFCSFRI
jgi:hypothetical protein